MNKVEDKLLTVLDQSKYEEADAYNIRVDGKSTRRKVSPYIEIESKTDKNGINVYIKDDTKF